MVEGVVSGGSGEWWSGVEWLLLACSCVSGRSKPTLGATSHRPSAGGAVREPWTSVTASPPTLPSKVTMRCWRTSSAERLRRDRALFISARRSALEVCRLASRSFLSLPVACVDASLVTVRYP